MDEKKKLIEVILEDLKFDGGDCRTCVKMGWKCPVYILENPSKEFMPDTSVCNFREQLYKTLTTEQY